MSLTMLDRQEALARLAKARPELMDYDHEGRIVLPEWQMEHLGLFSREQIAARKQEIILAEPGRYSWMNPPEVSFTCWPQELRDVAEEGEELSGEGAVAILKASYASQDAAGAQA